MTQAEQNAKQVWALSKGLASTTEGLVLTQDWDNRLVELSVGGTRQTMTWEGDAPWPGDRVRVTTAGERPYCVAIWGAPNGTVLSVDGTIATVSGDDGKTYTYPFITTPTVGWRVALSHPHRLILGRYSTEPEDSEFVPPPAAPSAGARTVDFYPTETGNYRSGAWTPGALEISDTRSAYMFYGTQIANTIPDGAQIHSCTLTLSEARDNVPGVSSKLGYHGFSGHPGSAPGLTGAINVFDGGVIDIGAYASALATGAAYGLGFPAGSGNGYRTFTGAPSAFITISFTP